MQHFWLWNKYLHVCFEISLQLIFFIYVIVYLDMWRSQYLLYCFTCTLGRRKKIMRVLIGQFDVKLTCRWEWIPSCESLNQAIMYLDNLVHSWLDVRLPLRASRKLGWHGILPLWPHVSGVELNGALYWCCLSTEQLQLETKGKSTNSAQ